MTISTIDTGGGMTPDKEYSGRSRIRMFNCDCMELMKTGKWDLAIVDPPYREKNDPDQWMRDKGGKMENFGKLPDDEYFKELERVSTNFICWGGNYFSDILPPNNNWIIWYKMNDGVHFSMAEMAYSTIRKNVKVFHHLHNGVSGKIHPTQKPVQLYKWLLTNYAKPGQAILDTHGGSMSIAIACWDLGFDLDICELDKGYFDAAVKRFEGHISQQVLF